MDLRNVFEKIAGRRKPLHLPVHIDEHGYRWADKDFFGFGDFSSEKDNLLLSYPSAEKYLRTHGGEYPWQDLWLTHGRTLDAPTRDECLRIHDANAHFADNCYNTALRVALRWQGPIITVLPPNEVLYCEGLAVHPTGMYLHAWLTLDGRVYDPVWPDAYRATYFGIEFIPEAVLAFAESFNKVSFLQNWEPAQKYVRSLLGEQPEPA